MRCAEGIKLRNMKEVIYYALFQDGNGNHCDRQKYMNREDSIKQFFHWVQEERSRCEKLYNSKFSVMNMHRFSELTKNEESEKFRAFANYLSNEWNCPYIDDEVIEEYIKTFN